MTSDDFVMLALQIAAMLAVAVGLGTLMRRIHQPAVLGEMLGGILLGPTILGALAPGLYSWLFYSSANAIIAREGLIKLGMLFFLFVAGLETDLSNLRRMGKQATAIGLVGTLLPIGLGIGLVYAIPEEFWGSVVDAHYFIFALFIGMNLANSANPVIARILMDMGILKSEIGTTIMTATIFDDLINWTLFAIILRDLAPTGQVFLTSVPASIIMVLVFFIAVLFLGRRVGSPALRWIKQHVSWPVGFIGITTLVVLVTSSVAEWLGIHAFLGAYLSGAALAQDDAEHRSAHEIVGNFALSFFAPIYFVSIGLTVNFATNFDFWLAVILLAAALVSKLGGVLLGARLAGLPLNRDTLAIAFGLNARGATGIILAGVGLANGVIDERLFVGIVIMCLATTFIASPVMKALLKGREEESLSI